MISISLRAVGIQKFCRTGDGGGAPATLFHFLHLHLKQAPTTD